MRRKLLYIIPGVVLVATGIWFVWPNSKPASATGDAYFVLSPTSGTYSVGNTITLSISEYSSAGDNTNAVGVNLSWPASLTWQSTTLTGPFTLCTSNSHTATTVSLACAATSAQSGTQAIATVAFTVASGGANASVGMTSGSDIDNTSGTSVWNGSLPGATFTLQGAGGHTPNPTPTPTPTPGTKSTKTTSTPKPSTTPTPSKSATPTPSASASPSSSPVPSTTSNASPGSISVTISDSKGRVSGAAVTIDGQTEQTNASGVANFAGINAGTHQVTVTAPGDQAYSASLVLGASQNKLVSYQLAKASGLGNLPLLILIGLVVLGAAGVAYWYLTSYMPAHLPMANTGEPAPAPAASPDELQVVEHPVVQPSVVMPQQTPPATPGPVDKP